MGKVLSPQVSVCLRLGGVHQSQVLSQVSGRVPQCWMAGTPVPGGGYPSTGQEVPRPGQGYPSPDRRYPSPGGTPGQGYPWSGQDWVSPGQDRTGVPPGQDRTRVLPSPPKTEQQSEDLLRVGIMPLTFMQEDLLMF